ncbi:katanin p80 WD40 repeat-containing subunit B1 [Wyeomyia smithii]|uniref:katanin p80 WD40 repeat-containing subunit B1 n=1 Tax=Wyeomyia smithii TaxID=174621 RepID=UPI002467DE68|nr:katanin p80 WD40 repeat-containing subunit B1 [Wyeomyia smithii]XP_055527059.1 katanin p80 WD40 repeat-containing subunit B1 [Wyeomyia smithii]
MALAARKTPTKIYDIQAHSNKVTCLDIGETGRVLVTGGQDRNVNLWTFGHRECFMSLTGHNAPIDCVKFACSDDHVYSADDTGVVKRWDLHSGTEYTTFYGHMKTVRTLDFHPYSEYVVSGSHDTSIRLWDVRQSVCIKRYRGHISHVNSVKFSPDGLWIASAGTEGSVIIWDIRMSKQFMEFSEGESPAMCVQYHPSDLLMAAGRNDGSVDLYDLEKKQLISRADKTHSKGHTVKCIAFDEGGSCLFVGTPAGISVIGWEPDQEYDHVDSTWTFLGDMMTAGQKLICGTYETRNVSIHVLNLSQVKPFYNPQNQPFNHHQSSRKSFSRGSGKVRLSIGDRSFSGEGHDDNKNGGMSPNLSIEMIDEEEPALAQEPQKGFDFSHRNGNGTNNFNSYSSPIASVGPSSVLVTQPSSSPLTNSNYLVKEEMKMFNMSTSTGYSCDLDYYPVKNNPSDAEKEDFPVKSAQPPDYAPKLTSLSTTSSTSTTSLIKSSLVRQKTEPSSSTTTTQQRRPSQPSVGLARNVTTSNLTRRISTSRSTLELNKLAQEEHVIYKKPISRGSSPIRNNTALSSKIRKSESSAQIGSHKNGTNRYSSASNHNANVKVEIVTKPVRSKTSLDLRQRNNNSEMHSTSATMSRAGIIHHNTSAVGGHSLTHIGISDSGGLDRDSLMMPPPPPASIIPVATHSLPQHHSYAPIIRLSHDGIATFTDGRGMGSNEEYEIQLLMNEHDSIFQALSNRTALLSAIRKYTQSGDVTMALQVAVRMNDQHLLVDLLGAILEKSAQFTLDMCVLLLPKIYELLQSEYKFHCTRACDTLRVILTTFLDMIRENTYGGCTLGVDISREERYRKCAECKKWLISIRSLPENAKIGTNLQQLQNMIVDL